MITTLVGQTQPTMEIQYVTFYRTARDEQLYLAANACAIDVVAASTKLHVKGLSMTGRRKETRASD